MIGDPSEAYSATMNNPGAVIQRQRRQRQQGRSRERLQQQQQQQQQQVFHNLQQHMLQGGSIGVGGGGGGGGVGPGAPGGVQLNSFQGGMPAAATADHHTWGNRSGGGRGEMEGGGGGSVTPPYGASYC